MLSKLAPRAVDRLEIASCDQRTDRDERVKIVHAHDTRVPGWDLDTETANVQEVELGLSIYVCPSLDAAVSDEPGRLRGSRNDAAGAKEIGLCIFCADSDELGFNRPEDLSFAGRGVDESADASSSDPAVANLDKFSC